MEELNYEIKKESSESVINAEKAESDNNSENNNENKEVFEENYKQMSPAKLIMRRFFRSKLSIVGIILIIFLFFFSIFGPMIYNKWGENEVDRTPVVKQYEKELTYTDEDGNIINVIQVIEITQQINSYAKPDGNHILGTDNKGMDVFTRLMYGGRISLSIGFIVIILETLLGVFFGGISGYFGKWVDQIIMRVVDIFNCIPTLPILLIAAALLDSLKVPGSMRIYWLMVIITIFGWDGTARMVRGQILSLREQEYMTATEVMGLPTWRKIFKHLIPNVMPQLIVSMTLGLGGVIIYESTLSYLGLGVQDPYAAWGTMISLANTPEILENYVNMWMPAGIMIVLAVLGFNFVGDGLRDAMDPRSKK